MPSVPGNHKPKASVRTRAVAAAQHARRAEMARLAEHPTGDRRTLRHPANKPSQSSSARPSPTPATTIDEYRAVELDKLDRLEQVALGVLGNTTTSSPAGQSSTTQDGEIAPLVDDAPSSRDQGDPPDLRTARRLLGLNAPAKVAIEGRQVHYVIDGVDISAIR